MKNTLFAKPIGYKIVQFLGEGLNSCVYRAIKEKEEFGVKFEVALKILKSEKLVSLWRNEFDRLSAIRSQHCVQLYGWEIFNGMPTLVLEFVDGVTLDEMTKMGRLTQNDLNEIMAQAICGLKDLEKAGVFHGDLNLHNIMIDRKGRVSLVDFGIASSEHDVFATPHYAAPEVLMGGRPNLSTDLLSIRLIAEEIAIQQNLKTQPDLMLLKSEPAREFHLSFLVNEVQQLRQLQVGLTQKISNLNTNNGESKILAMGLAKMALILFCFLPLVSNGDQKKLHKYTQFARIAIRTAEWAQIITPDGHSHFSPCDLVVEAEKPIHLQWSTPARSSESTLTLKPDQHIVLGDTFFAKD